MKEYLNFCVHMAESTTSDSLLYFSENELELYVLI